MIYEAFKAKELPLFVAYYRRSLPRFTQVKEWLDNDEIGQIRHISSQLSQPPSVLDLSAEYNWRTDANVAPGGYFDDLASHGLNLFTYLLGDIKEAFGVNFNQQGLYTAKDAIAACWCHEDNITGVGNWNFASNVKEDRVKIFGSSGEITFSIFEECPILLNNGSGKQELFIKHPENVQLPHVALMKEHLLEKSAHPSMGLAAVHTSWVMDRILGSI